MIWGIQKVKQVGEAFPEAICVLLDARTAQLTTIDNLQRSNTDLIIHKAPSNALLPVYWQQIERAIMISDPAQTRECLHVQV